MKLRGWRLWLFLATFAVEASSAKFSPVGRLLRFFEKSKTCSPSCIEPRGRCVEGRCQCSEGYSGETCETQVPVAPLAVPAAPAAPVAAPVLRARAAAEALGALQTPVAAAAARARRIAAAVRGTREHVEHVEHVNSRFLKEAMQASHQALENVAVLRKSEVSARASLAEETIFKDSPLRDAQGLMDSINHYIHPSTTIFHLTTTEGPNITQLRHVKRLSGSCIDDCSGHGSCSMGVCRCEEGFMGEACDVVRCKEDCNGRGSCLSGQCACDSAYYGGACEFPRCKDDCNGHGYCESGKCVCTGGFRGESCAERAPLPRVILPKAEPKEELPVLNTKETQSIAPPSCPGDCNQHGRCELDGTCSCMANYTGLACENHCPSSCSGKGACTGGQCICFFGWGGVDCSLPMCCNGHGDCPIPGTCKCHEGFMGEQCEIEMKCPDPDCSGHGACSLGTCRCQHGWSGVACQQYQPPPGAMNSIPPAFIPAAPGPQGYPLPATALLGLPAKQESHVLAAPAPSCNAPHGRWSDDLETCICEAPFHGEDCREKHCPDWDGTEGGKECSGNGVCQQGKCFCLPGFGVANASSPNICGDAVCVADCGSHGECKDGECRCDPGWQGATCREPQCEDDCNGHGLCIFPQPGHPGACRCEEGFLPPNCGERQASALRRARHQEMTAIRLD